MRTMISGVILLFFSQAKAQDSIIQPKPITSPEIHLDTLYDPIEYLISPTPLPDIVINLTKSNYEIEQEKKEEQRLVEEKQKQEAEEKRLAELNLIEEHIKEEKRKNDEKIEREKKEAEERRRLVATAPKGKQLVSIVSSVKNEYCSCVTYAKKISGINVGSIGVARNHPINSQVPKVGAIGVSAEGKVGHVWVVTAINGDMITIDEANYKHCQRTTRVLNKNSSIIRGYYAI